MGALNFLPTAIKSYSENDEATADFSTCSWPAFGVSARMVVIFCYRKKGYMTWARGILKSYHRSNSSNSSHCTPNLNNYK